LYRKSSCNDKAVSNCGRKRLAINIVKVLVQPMFSAQPFISSSAPTVTQGRIRILDVVCFDKMNARILHVSRIDDKEQPGWTFDRKLLWLTRLCTFRHSPGMIDFNWWQVIYSSQVFFFSMFILGTNRALCLEAFFKPSLGNIEGFDGCCVMANTA
jgi:hypothetical protein